MAEGAATAVSLLDAHLTEEERELLAECEQSATEVFAPLALAHEEAGHGSSLDRELIGAIAEAGLYERLYRRSDDGTCCARSADCRAHRTRAASRCATASDSASTRL